MRNLLINDKESALISMTCSHSHPFIHGTFSSILAFLQVCWSCFGHSRLASTVDRHHYAAWWRRKLSRLSVGVLSFPSFVPDYGAWSRSLAASGFWSYCAYVALEYIELIYLLLIIDRDAENALCGRWDEKAACSNPVTPPNQINGSNRFIFFPLARQFLFLKGRKNLLFYRK